MDTPIFDVDLSKRFGKTQVLENVRFQVNQNEFLVIVGPTGCGKTTLGNILAGIDSPTLGHARIRGEKVNPKVHNISYVFQEPSCIPWMSMIQDVTLGLEIRGFEKDRVVKRGREVIDLVGLSGFEDYFPCRFPWAPKHQKAIARAYATNPDMLIMDEPFGHLDAQTRYLMQAEIMRIWEQDKKTVVFITNNIEEAVYLASRILVLSKLPATIKAEHVVDLPRPRDLTGAEFLNVRSGVTEECEVVE
jgi:ABC-type nitrate/sulfonate/bicarbonate transport system ATPase subunit